MTPLFPSSQLQHSHLFLLLSLLLLAFQSPRSAATDPLFSICENTHNYTGGGTFEANLAVLLTSLRSTAPATGFSNDTVGQKPDRVRGLAMCRGDRTEAQCRDCLADAAEGVTRACPNRKGATTWYETCQLRYSQKGFFGSPSGEKFYMYNVNNVSDPASFGRQLGGLLDGLTRRAANGPPPSRMFAAGEANYTGGGGGKIYGLVQCTRDLSAGDCDRCLRDQIGMIATGRQGGRLIGGSCNLRYELYAFYNATVGADQLPPPMPAVTPMPAMTPAAWSPSTTPASAATVHKATLGVFGLLLSFFFLSVIS